MRLRAGPECVAGLFDGFFNTINDLSKQATDAVGDLSNTVVNLGTHGERLKGNGGVQRCLVGRGRHAYSRHPPRVSAGKGGICIQQTTSERHWWEGGDMDQRVCWILL